MTDKAAYIDTTEFGKILNISSLTIAKYLRAGKIKGKKIAGKWMISKQEFDTPFIRNLSKEKAPDKTQKTEIPEPRTFSVSEFSKLTYLTEKGVLEWLKKGLITGNKNAQGDFTIDESNLEHPNIKRLIRT
jgi:predicted site-specific integrase-resolvase